MADNTTENRLQVGVGFKIDDIGGGLTDFGKKAENINKAIKELVKGMEDLEERTKRGGKGFSEATKTMNEYGAKLIDSKEALKALEKEQEKLTNQIKKVGKGSKEYDKLVAQLKKVKDNINKITKESTEEQRNLEKLRLQEAQKSNKQMTSDFDKMQKLNIKSAKDSAEVFKQIEAEKEEYIRQQLSKTTTAYKQAMNERKQSSSLLAGQLGAQNTNIADRFLGSAIRLTGAYALIHEFQNLGRAVVDIEYNTINNMRLMGEFSDELRDSLNASAAEIARSTGIMITDAQEIQGAWIRINKRYAENADLLKEMSEITSKFMNIGEIEDAEHAVTLLNSTLLQFGLDKGDVAANVEDVANKFAYMADVTSMGTADEYAEGIAKMGANIKNMNGDIDDAIVLLSIVGDKLAKDGTEAGNALNTFTAYMHRAKTLTLFDQIAADLGDVNLSLRDGEKGLKNYKDSIETIAKAYRLMKDAGNEIGANKIIEALGATRQRATAQAVLDAIAYTDNGITALEQYEQLLQGATASGSYLEEQNAILMDTLTNKWNSFVATLQEAGVHIANSGLIEGLELVMGGAEAATNAINLMPKPLIAAMTAMLGFKAATSGLSKLGAITGYTNKLAQSLKYGSNELAAMANTTRISTDSYLDYQKTVFASATANDKLTSAYIAQQNALTQLEQGALSANMTLYATGDVEAYIAEMKSLKLAYLDNITAVDLSNLSEEQRAAVIQRNNALMQAETFIEHKKNAAKKKSLIALMAENGYKKASTVLSKTKYVWDNLLLILTGKQTAATKGLTIAQAASNITTAITTGLTTALGVALNFLLSPLTLVTLGFTALSMLFSSRKSDLEKYTEGVDNLKSSISDLESRISELKEIQQQSGLSGTEEAELKYAEEMLRIEKERLEIEERKKRNAEYDEKSNDIKHTIADYKSLINSAKQYQDLIENENFMPDSITGTYVDKNGMWTNEYKKSLEATNKNIRDNIKELMEYYSYLQYVTGDSGGTPLLDGDALRNAKSDLQAIKNILPDISDEVEAVNKANLTESLLDDTSIEDFNDKLGEAMASLNEYDEDIEKLIDGASSSELLDMVDKYNGFSNYIGKSTAEQIAYIRSLQGNSKDAILDEINNQIVEYENLINTLNNEIQTIANQDTLSDSDKKTITDKNEQLQKSLELLNELRAKKDIAINLTLNDDSFYLGDLMNQMDKLVSSTKSLVEAQNQLATGAALSKEQLWNLAMQYPEMLYQANLFADGSVSGQKAAIEAIMDMKNQEFNQDVDLKINELEATRDYIQDILNLEEQKYNAIVDGKIQTAEGVLDIEADTGKFIQEYNNLIGQQYTATENQKVEKTAESGEYRVDAENQTGEKITAATNQAGKAIMESITNGSAAGIDGLNQNATKVGTIFENIKNWASNLAKWVAKALAGDDSGAGSVSGGGSAGVYANTFKGAVYDAVNKTIDGKSITEWQNEQKELLKQNIDAYKVQLNGINTAISNLEAFKNLGLTEISNKYSDKGAGGETGNKDTSGKGSGSKDDNTKALEEATKAIEKLTEQYIKNVESMQDRIAKALKKKYQEQYDERKKLLEKEHNDRVEQIQAEIDKINGNTPQDKKSQLARLQEQYNKWLADDSTLGKSKQKEYLDQIKELEKEIKIDELEAKLDEENEKYDQSIDKDSEFYDAILKKLDQQMTDEALYREANDMIINGKTQEIIDLLTKYDAKWDGWATLMGKTAGEIIADEVALAIANYIDVMKGTITEDGGAYTNKVTGNSTTTSSSSSTGGSTTSSSSQPVKKGSRAKITNTNAGMYYTASSGSAVGTWSGYNGNYYVVNDVNGRAALSKTNNINGAIGWIDKKHLVGLATGGYVNNEGIAMLHAKERVLTARQTTAFENLIYNQLPKLEKQYSSTGDFGGNISNFNKELVSINVDNVNNYTPVDVRNMEDNIDRMFRVSLQKAGIRKPR